MNLENNLRSQVRKILNNPKLQRGYEADTLQAMQNFNSGSRTANVMRMLSNALGGGGGV
jgi:cytochrome c553